MNLTNKPEVVKVAYPCDVFTYLNVVTAFMASAAAVMCIFRSEATCSDKRPNAEEIASKLQNVSLKMKAQIDKE